ncbi:unnamed protein product [Bursaphelenchus okinawaensis]|uniref:Sodium/hydrogen exchanger n=1 Tax=Bursaphelenchus okinawaensis TaxID=465554 RepID=A0A811K6D5_9BILA|nr:unnamed protein product [Bursaphelenchus okinawaensis]CAG9092346.1 unnamed protein product [Bursaphelenchus okinawaensis]
MDVEREQQPSANLISYNLHHVQGPLQVALWILAASVAKILFHVHKKFGELIPDSALLISLGLVLGLLFKQFDLIGHYNLDSTVFFLYLLPPIIFEAGYFMPNRQCFENFSSIATFSIIGTVWNTVTIGLTLYAGASCNLYNIDVKWPELFTYAALISAIDPVAVIVVFEELHVNEFLFVNVFGEALFNDGIAAVLFQIFNRLTAVGTDNIAKFTASDYAILSSTGCFVAIGGVTIGIVFALACAISTKYTQRVKVVGPVFVFLFPYLAYLTAEMFALSAILAICFCGIFMKEYVKGNISVEAAASVKHFVKMLSQACETVVFMFLGLSAVASKFSFDFYFVVITLLACIVYRALGVFVQCLCLNPFLKQKFSFKDQIVMSYGGLRGAIAFGLLSNIPSSLDEKVKDVFTTTTIIVICFTVFVQGTTIRPLLNYLQIEKQTHGTATFVERMFDKYFDYAMSGIEDILDQKGTNTIRSWFEQLNARYLKPLLIQNTSSKAFDNTVIIRAYNKVTAGEVLALNQEMMTRRKSRHLLTIKTQNELDGIENVAFDNQSISSCSNSVGNRELEQFLHKQENMDAMCTMIDKIVTKKLETFNRATSNQKRQSKDIHDDYLTGINSKLEE